MNLPEEVMWTAVQNCDPNYDGQFFYAVKTTGIFCRPSCRSKTPMRHHVRYYPLVEMAIQDGFRPCKRCRPDLLVPPGEEEVICEAKAILEREYASPHPLEELARQVGMSKYHLQRTFKKVTGMTPSEFVTQLRMAKAAELLLQTPLSITQIAHEVGYQSSSHFSVLFQQQTGCSPSQFRQTYKKGALS